jgi:hypothetical protein
MIDCDEAKSLKKIVFEKEVVSVSLKLYSPTGAKVVASVSTSAPRKFWK